MSSLIDADLLILLSDVDGFYWDMKDEGPVEQIDKITTEIFQRAGDSGSIGGTGGMVTKLKAAEMIMRFGEKMIIANSSIPGVLNRIMDGEKIGTIFVGSDRRMPSRKKWVALRKTRGALTLDDGAVNAICDGKKITSCLGRHRCQRHF